MGDAENTLQPSKKRAAGRELSRDNPGLDDEEGAFEEETGTFKRASEEVLAARRIVKVRRSQTSSSAPSAASSNPFAGICLLPPVSAAVEKESGKTLSEEVGETDEVHKGTEKKENDDVSKVTEEEKTNMSESKVGEAGAESTEGSEKTDSVKAEAVLIDDKAKEDNKTENGDKELAATNDKKDSGGGEGQSLSSFQQLSSSRNAFTGLAGSGFSTSSFSFGTIPKDGSPSLGPGFLSGLKSPSFGFGLSSNGSSLSGTPATTSIGSQSEGSGVPSMKEVLVETGEENEKVVFSADSVLFEFLDGGWKERGKGELKVNVPTTGMGKARLVMRARGNYRLILNASLYADMKLASMEKKGITFACANSTGEGKDGLCTVALKFKDASIVEDFRSTVTKYKDKTATATAAVLKTPENSPKASDD